MDGKFRPDDKINYTMRKEATKEMGKIISSQIRGRIVRKILILTHIFLPIFPCLARPPPLHLAATLSPRYVMTVFLRIRGQLADNALIPEQDEPHDVADKRTKFYANDRS